MVKLKYLFNLLIVTLLFAVTAIVRDSRIVGYPISEITGKEQPQPPVESVVAGQRVLNSTAVAREVVGFGGRTPVQIFLSEDLIERVELLPNAETPSYVRSIVESGMLSAWNGMTLPEAAEAHVDAISGATFTSVAIAENVRLTAQHVASVDAERRAVPNWLNAKTIIALLVVLSGAIFTLVRPKRKIFEVAQLTLNVVVLGFWCGSFLSLAQLTSWAANGVNLSMSLISIALLAVVVLMPLLDRKGSYCHIHCPLGSAQALLGKLPVKRLKLSPKINKALGQVRNYVLIALIFTMWAGVAADLVNYELFSLFMLGAASTVVLVLGAIFLLLSIFIPKPYCRFVCPTGAMLTALQRTDYK